MQKQRAHTQHILKDLIKYPHFHSKCVSVSLCVRWYLLPIYLSITFYLPFRIEYVYRQLWMRSNTKHVRNFVADVVVAVHHVSRFICCGCRFSPPLAERQRLLSRLAAMITHLLWFPSKQQKCKQ